MADIIDRANDRAEQDLDRAVQAARRVSGPDPVGYCLSCGPDVPLPHPLRWCDGDCRDDWQKAQSSQGRRT